MAKRKSINEYPVGQYILDALKERGMSQAELAAKTRVSAPVINDIIKCRRPASAKQLVKFGLVLGLDAIEMGRMQSDYEIMQVINPLFEKSEETEQS